VLSKPPIRAATFVHVKAGEEDDVVTEAPTRNRVVILCLVCAAQLMVVLDIAIVNVALPSIQRDHRVGQSTLQWVVIALWPHTGRVPAVRGQDDRPAGRRPILLTGMTVFSRPTWI
jgi:hypothetical protein